MINPFLKNKEIIQPAKPAVVEYKSKKGFSKVKSNKLSILTAPKKEKS